MPRPSTGARDRLVQSALTQLRRGGLSAAGLNDVVAHAQAPKGSLYHYFPGGKTELVEAALLAYDERIGALLRQVLGGDGPLERRLAALFEAVERRMAADAYAQSCAVGAVILDLQAGDVRLLGTCRAILDRWARIAAEHFTELPVERRGPLARSLITVLEGAQLMARAEQGARPLREAAGAFAGLL